MSELVNVETGEIVDPLTETERAKLASKEAVIENAREAAGKALGDIRDGRLYPGVLRDV